MAMVELVQDHEHRTVIGTDGVLNERLTSHGNRMSNPVSPAVTVRAGRGFFVAVCSQYDLLHLGHHACVRSRDAESGNRTSTSR